MISISGMTSRVALTLLDKTETAQLQGIRNDPATARAIANFRKAVGGIQSAKDLVNNYDVYSFVMKAFDLKDQMFGKAMIQKILESNPADPASLINRMTDPRFADLYNAMGFTNAGTANPNTGSSVWQDQIVQRFVQQQYINTEGAQNATVGAVLNFRQKVGQVTSWYDILKDKKMGEFMRTALGIPQGVVNQDLTRQVSLFQQKYDITKLRDPAEVARLVDKYVALSDAKNAQQNAATDPAVTMMAGAAAFAAGGQFVPATLNIASIDLSALKIYN